MGIRPERGPKGIYGERWTGPLFVLTHRIPDGSEDPEITFLSDGIENAVAAARAGVQRKSVGIFGANVARQCIEHGLLDDIIVHLVPTLLGDGVRFYDAPGVGPIALELTIASEAGQVTDLHFRVLSRGITVRWRAPARPGVGRAMPNLSPLARRWIDYLPCQVIEIVWTDGCAPLGAKLTRTRT
ncbi:MAG: hypothetical protein WBP81_27275 [Solirubrobacteraceae bacterium]